MKKILHKIFRIRILLLLFFILTIVYLIINPEFIYNSNKHFNVTKRTIYGAHQFTLLPENPFADVVTLSNYKNKSDIHYISFKNGLFRQIELLDYSIFTNYKKTYGDKIFHFKNDYIYTITYQNNNEYILMKLYGDNNFNTQKYMFYKHPIYNELKKDSIVVNSICFNGIKVKNSSKDNISIHPLNNGYFLEYTLDFYKDLYGYADINNEKILQASKQLTEYFKYDFTPSDVFKINSFFSRRNYYKKSLFNNNGNEKLGLFPASIIGETDSNNDGIMDPVIIIRGSRFVDDNIICLNGKNIQPLWNTIVSSSAINEKIIDIDSDGSDEILLSFYSPCNDLPIDFYERETIGKDGYARFLILDNKGKIRKIADMDMLSEKISFGNYNYLYIPETKKILLSLLMKSPKEQKELLLYDVQKDVIDTLDFKYNSISGMYREENNIVVLNYNNFQLTKNIFSLNLKLISSKTISVEKKMLFNMPRNQKIAGSNYLITDDLIIFDKNMKMVYKFTGMVRGKVNWIGDDCYLIEKQGNKYNLVSLHFERNRKVNPYAIIIILVQLLLLIIYILLNQLLRIPLSIPGNSYLICYQIMGKLYYWKLYGELKDNIDLPRKLTRDSIDIENLLDNLGTQYTKNYERNFFFLKLSFYEIKKRDEFEIIRRISHDLKNQTLTLKLAIEKFGKKFSQEDYKQQKELEIIAAHCKSISNTSLSLSNFSHIDRIFKETIELNSFVKNILFRYINYPKFEHISTLYIKHKIYVSIDKKLFEIAIRNILNNALEAIKHEGNIRISLKETSSKVRINVLNNYSDPIFNANNINKIGFSTKKNGSGIGLPVSKIIMERNNGKLKYRLGSGFFLITLELSKIAELKNDENSNSRR